MTQDELGIGSRTRLRGALDGDRASRSSFIPLVARKPGAFPGSPPLVGLRAKRHARTCTRQRMEQVEPMVIRSAPPTSGVRSSTDRRSLLVIGGVTTALASLHLADHVLRGRQVDHANLDPTWDHSGWPFTSDITPFTFSLVLVLSILLGGLLLTARGKAWAGYWLGASMVLGAIVTVVHFVPTANQESPAVIYGSWPDQPVIGALAVALTFAIVGVLVLMGVNAVRVRRRSGSWR